MTKHTSKILPFLMGLCIIGGTLFLSSCGKDDEVKPSSVAVTGVTLSPTTKTLPLAGTQQLTATIAPANASNSKVTWSSSSQAVATVNATGLVTAVAAGTATITATTEDGAKTATATITVTDFSDLSVEQNKAKLEENGISLVNDLTEIKNADGIETAQTLLNLFFTDEEEVPPTGGRQSLALRKSMSVLQLLSNFKNGKTTARDVMAGMRTSEGDDDPGSPQEAWNEVAGVYSYNSATEEFDTTSLGGNAIVLRFPSTEGGVNNNAELKVYDFTYVTINNLELEYDKDVPTGLKFYIAVNDVKQIEYLFAATYKENGEPKTLATSLALNPFKISVDLANTSARAAVNYKLTKSDNNLLAYGAEAWGDFTSANLEDPETPGDVADSAALYVQVLNIKFVGKAKVKALDDALGDDSTPQQEVAAINANTKIVVLYADSNLKIAKAEFYVDDTDGEAHTEVRLVFSDGSKSDVENYINAGFEDLETSVKDLLEIKDDEEG
jgi:hypothetical protein